MAFLVIRCLFSEISTATPTTVLKSTLSEDFVPITGYCLYWYIIKEDSCWYFSKLVGLGSFYGCKLGEGTDFKDRGSLTLLAAGLWGKNSIRSECKLSYACIMNVWTLL